MTARSIGRGAAAVLMCSLAASACSRSGGETAAAPPAAAPAADRDATSTGSHRVVGKAPPAVNGMSSVVVLDPQVAREYAAPAWRPAMDQVTQTFVPAILFVRTGRPTDFKNSDDVLHNVRVRNVETKEGTFNVAIPTGQIYTHTFDHDGFYDVGCDIHPGMSAQIIATSTPYAGLADAAGDFAFDGVEPGVYKLSIYFGTQKTEKIIDVAGAVTTVGE